MILYPHEKIKIWIDNHLFSLLIIIIIIGFYLNLNFIHNLITIQPYNCCELGAK